MVAAAANIYAAAVNAATSREPIAPECASDSAGLGSLLPWMTQLGSFESGELRTVCANEGALPSREPSAAFALAALRVSDRLLRQFFDDSPIGVAVFDAGGWLVQLNPAFGALLGYAAADLRDRNIDELIHPCDVPLLQEHRRMLVDGQCDEFRIEPRFGTADRREVCTWMCGRLERPASGHRPHVFAHIMDLTAVRNVACGAVDADWMTWDPDRYMD